MSIVYKPPGPVAHAFMMCDEFVSAIMGPVGSGKSTACIMKILKKARQQRPGPDGKRKSRWAIIRNTYPELKTTTIRSWHQWMPQTLGRWVDSGPPTHYINEGDIELEVIFLALDSADDVKKLLSLELTGAWINEAREVPKSVLDALTARVGRFPSVLMGGCSWYGVIMDTNPPDTDHWWYKLAEEENPEGFKFFRQPGGRSVGAENVANLPPLYYDRMCAGKKKDWIKVYVDAEYGFVQDGKPVYSDYVDSLHCRQVHYVKGLRLHIGIDFGLTPAAILGQRTIMGQMRWLTELVTDSVGMGAQKFGRLLRTHIGEYYPDVEIGSITGDPAGVSRAQTDEDNVFNVLKGAGIEAHPAYTNNFDIRTGAVSGALSRLIDGEPGLVISPICRTARKGMSGGYRYKRVRIAGEERYHDVPDKNMFSHVCEAGQYQMLGAGEGKVLIGADRDGPLMVGGDSHDYGSFTV